MFRLASTTLAAVLTAAVQPDALLAQVPSPRVSTVVESADELYRQLDYVMGLTTPQEQQQTKNLKEHFDVFLIGVSRDKPGRMDLLIDAEKFRYLLAVPVTAANLNNFRANNLTPLGLDNRRISPTLYRFHNKVWNGFMRFANDYALFGERKEDVPPNVPDPTLAIAGVLKQGYHAAFDLEVQNPAPMSQQERRDNFNHPDGIREVMLKSLEQGANESNDEFALRKLTVEHQLDELERLYAEAFQARIGWVLEPKESRGRFDLAVEPIPGTELASMVASLGQELSRFAGIPRAEGTILSARVNHPLDPMRQQNFRETFRLLADNAKRKIDADAERTAEHKNAAKQTVDDIYDLLDANLKAGLAEGFAEVQPREDGRHTGVSALRTVDGTAAVNIIQGLPAGRPGRQVQLDVDKHGETRIHSVQVMAQDHPGFRDFFGDDKLYFGTSQEVVWLAAGVDAIAALKTAIDQSAAPPANPPPVERAVALYAKLGPWVDLMHKRLGMADDPQRQKWRRLAIDAFEPGDDVINLRIDRAEANLRGDMLVQPGLLRYIGKLFADFSKENLEDGK